MENPALMQAVALIAELDEQEEAVIEETMMALAQVAVADVMELEEPGVNARALEDSWVYITVDINEYHLMGDPIFKMHFRMSRIVFELLVQTVADHLRSKGRMKRERTPFQDIMLMVVWVMATPDSFRSVALRFGRRPSSLWYFYSYVIEALRELAPRFVSWPNAEERVTIKTAFQRASRFPGIIGCIDCTHIYITAPVQDAAHYVNRHDTYSINVQTVVDHNLLVRELHVGEVGSMHDKRVFRRSPLCHNLLKVDGERLLEADEHLVGDGGYTLTDFMMIPFPNDGRINEAQRDFNYSLSQCRVRVENGYARAKEFWRRLKFLHGRNPSIRTDHITASFVLHNFTILNGEEIWMENELERPIAANDVLGGEEFEDEDIADLNDAEQVDEELMDAAKVRGEEKRIFIMNNVLPLLEAKDYCCWYRDPVLKKKKTDYWCILDMQSCVPFPTIIWGSEQQAIVKVRELMERKEYLQEQFIIEMSVLPQTKLNTLIMNKWIPHKEITLKYETET